jgi:hypothetical protein
MNVSLYIDEVNIFTAFGTIITKGGYNDLFTFPSMKEPDKNDWAEEYGTEVDLSEIRLNAKEVFISFCSAEFLGFMDFIKQPGYREFYIPQLGRTWNLRYISQESNAMPDTERSAFTLKFAEDILVRETSGEAVPGLIILLSNYSIDGKPLRDYGIIASEARNNLLSSWQEKQNMNYEVSYKDGRVYDAGTLTLSEKDVTLNFTLCASNLENFWDCYNAFFNDLIATGERKLNIAGIKKCGCYYKSSSNFKLLPMRGGVFVEFNLVLALISETYYKKMRITGDRMWRLTTDREARLVK